MHVAQSNPEDGAPGVLTSLSASGTKALVSLGELTVHDLTVVGALTLTLAGGAKGYRHCMEVWLRQDSSGHSVTLPSNVTWLAGSTPTISTTPNSITVLQFATSDGGATWGAQVVGASGGSGMANPMTTAGDIITGGSAGAAQRLAVGSANQVLTVVSGAPAWAANPGGGADALEFVIDGGGSAITTGMKGYIQVPWACTINQSTLLADQSGSIVVDVWKCSYSNFDAGSTHPVSGDKITASAPPTISSATKAQDSTLTGWTTSLAAGDILGFNVNSITTCTRVTISLKVAKS
jgi:hypothetical protein